MAERGGRSASYQLGTPRVVGVSHPDTDGVAIGVGQRPGITAAVACSRLEGNHREVATPRGRPAGRSGRSRPERISVTIAAD